jgi:hypothetical protein
MVLGLAAVFGVGAPSSAEELKAGVAVREITPPANYRMSGYFSERLSTGVHDPLKAKALVLVQGTESAALVFCDLSGIAAEVSARARASASRRTGIPAANILIAATHSHTGPMYFGALRNHFHDRTVAEHGTDVYETIDYPSRLVEEIARAIEEAQSAARPVDLAAGVARETRLSFNRRFHMKDGGVRTNPGKQNPDIVRAAGPIDPDVGLLILRGTADARTLASLTVFALHLDTVGGTEYSADYPYYLERSLQKNFGAPFVSLFGAGTCGDINHVDVSHGERQKGHGEAERIGTALAETVAAAIPRLKPVAHPSLAVRSATVEAPLQTYSSAEVARAQSELSKVDDDRVPFLERVETYKIAALQLLGGTVLPAEVQVFRLSDDVAIVGLPGEVFVELGLAIKEASPFETTIVVELANDAPGYVPTRKAFAEGSYEVVNSRVASGGGERLVERAIELFEQLKD